MRKVTLKIVDTFIAAAISLFFGMLISFWVGVPAFILGLWIVFRKKSKQSDMYTPNNGAVEEPASGEWLEEWHDDMRRWQIGPYERQD